MPKAAYPSIRVFENPWLEKMTHVHPVIPILLWAPIVSFLFYRSFAVHGLSVLTFAWLGILGLFAWTLTEYLLHRFIFHFTPTTPTQERLEFLMHGLHHADPKDPTRLVMPPAGSLILGAIVFSICRGLFGPIWAEPLFGFLVIGYLCYDYVHYFIHHSNPRTVFGKIVKQHHMKHHFVTPNARWGVSSPLWDHVFGTLEEKHERTNEQII